MSLALTGALAVALINVMAGRWFARSGGPRSDGFWRMQAAGFAFRFATIFGGAYWIWAAHRQMSEVAMFIVIGAATQTAGQIYFLMKDRKTNA